MDSDSKPKSKFQKFRHAVFNVRAWSDWDRSQSISMYFLSIIRKLFVLQTRVASDEDKTFSDVALSLNLTEDDLKSKAISLKRLCYIMIFTAICFYSYAMYQLIYGGILAVILSFVLMFVSLAVAFRYHFWYFQIAHRKLGCSLGEWFKNSFMDGDK